LDLPHVAVHDFETRSQVQTDSNNAALSSYDDLRHNNDGSVDLYFGPTAPEGYENNWVKTIPRDILRQVLAADGF
jgi:hypothetical protein